MHDYVKGIDSVYQRHANDDRATSAKAYLRNQFEFYGLSMPLRRQVSKEYIKEKGLPLYDELEQIVKELYALPQREFQYFAIEIAAGLKKQWKQDTIALFEYMIVTKSWWDTVDYINSELCAPFFKRFPGDIKKITFGWNRSDNFWLQRSSLLFQKNYKAALDNGLLTDYILHLSQSKEFFIQKAIGWVLREHSRFDPGWVRSFVEKHELPPLSKREALKTILKKLQDN
jgi:3-methyladenine DNA glycosylase AlkD